MPQVHHYQMNDKHVNYWFESAKHDLDVAQSLFDNGRYDWCLFIAHLVLEKMLKACYVKINGKFPPKTHDLVRLASLAKIDFDDDTLDFLYKANTFNLSVRYPDEKLKFYRLCTHVFTKNVFSRMKVIYQCLTQKIITSELPGNF